MWLGCGFRHSRQAPGYMPSKGARWPPQKAYIRFHCYLIDCDSSILLPVSPNNNRNKKDPGCSGAICYLLWTFGTVGRTMGIEGLVFMATPPFREVLQIGQPMQ